MTRAERSKEPLSATTEQRGRAAHLRLFGEIDLATAPLLEGWLQTVESNDSTAIVVDLGAITFMDACGLRTFLGAAERAGRKGRSFAITRPPAVVRRILQITGTTHLLAANTLAHSPDHHPADLWRASVPPLGQLGTERTLPGDTPSRRLDAEHPSLPGLLGELRPGTLEPEARS